MRQLQNKCSPIILSDSSFDAFFNSKKHVFFIFSIFDLFPKFWVKKSGHVGGSWKHFFCSDSSKKYRWKLILCRNVTLSTPEILRRSNHLYSVTTRNYQPKHGKTLKAPVALQQSCPEEPTVGCCSWLQPLSPQC